MMTDCSRDWAAPEPCPSARRPLLSLLRGWRECLHHPGKLFEKGTLWRTLVNRVWLLNGFIDLLCNYTELGARHEAPQDADRAGGAILPPTAGRRTALRPWCQDRPSRSQIGQHVPVGEHDGQDWRLWTRCPSPLGFQSVRLSFFSFFFHSGTSLSTRCHTVALPPSSLLNRLELI